MLLVKTKILPSSIAWIGLFADQFIPTWTEIRRFTPWFDLKFSKEEITKFPALLQEHFETYSRLSKKSGMYCFSSDHGKFFNHSATNNNILSAYYDNEEEVVTKAIRDIQIGEELLDNYGSFEQGFSEESLYNT